MREQLLNIRFLFVCLLLFLARERKSKSCNKVKCTSLYSGLKKILGRVVRVCLMKLILLMIVIVTTTTTMMGTGNGY